MSSDELHPDVAASVVDDTQIKAAQQCVLELLKSFKQMALYRHQPAIFDSFIEKAHSVYRAYFGAYGDLELSISPRALTLDDQIVIEESAETRFFVARMHTEGVRKLTFNTGLDLDELRGFATLFLESGEADSQVDLVTRWWQAGFRHITSIVVDTLEPDEAGAVEMEVERLIAIFRAQLAGTGPDVIRSIQVSTTDFETSLDNVESLRAIVRDGVANTQTGRELARQRLQMDTDQHVARLLPLFGRLPPGPRTAEMIVRSFLPHLIGTCFSLGRFDAFGLMWRAVEASLQDPQQLQAARQEFLVHLGRPQHANTLAACLNSGAVTSEEGLVEFALRFGSGMEAWWADVFGKVDHRGGRQILVAAVRAIPDLRPGAFDPLLSHENPRIVRRAVQIVAASPSSQAEAMLSRCLDAREEDVRLEALNALAARGPQSCRRHLAGRLDRGDANMRRAVARSLARFDPEHAALLLANRLAEKNAARLEEEERKDLYVSLALTGQPAADTFFDGFFVPVGVFSAGQKKQRQLEAAGALVKAIDVPAVRDCVRRVVGFEGLNEAVRSVLRDALARAGG